MMPPTQFGTQQHRNNAPTAISTYIIVLLFFLGFPSPSLTPPLPAFLGISSSASSSSPSSSSSDFFLGVSSSSSPSSAASSFSSSSSCSSGSGAGFFSSSSAWTTNTSWHFGHLTFLPGGTGA